MIRELAPLLYFLSLAVVFVLSIFTTILSESVVGFFTWKRVGDVNVVMSILMLGIPFLTATTLKLLHKEPRKEFSFGIHLWHCGFLYCLIFIFSMTLYSNILEQGELLYWHYLVVLAVLVFSVIVNLTTIIYWAVRDIP